MEVASEVMREKLGLALDVAQDYKPTSVSGMIPLDVDVGDGKSRWLMQGQT